MDQFVLQIGKGVIKLLIMDREFIDGAMISRFKKTHGIDCLVPLKSNMHALLDALGIARMEKVNWIKYEEVKDERGKVVEVEEVAGVGKVGSWTAVGFRSMLSWYGPGRQMARVRSGPWLQPRNSRESLG